MFDFSAVHWFAVLASVVAGQVISTVWFAVVFAKPWAAEYGVATPKEHTAAIPPYTYGVQLLTTVAMMLGLALLLPAVGATGPVGGLTVGLLVAACFVLPAVLPGQAFLQRWRVAALTAGCQGTMAVVISIILASWR